MLFLKRCPGRIFSILVGVAVVILGLLWRNNTKNLSLPLATHRDVSTAEPTATTDDITQNNDYEYLHRGIVQGQVVDSAGKSVEGVEVNFEALDKDIDHNPSSDTTDAKGRFKSWSLPVNLKKGGANYKITAIHPRFSQTTKTIWVRARSKKDDFMRLSLTMQPRALITGRVTFRGKPYRALVGLDDFGGEWYMNRDYEEKNDFARPETVADSNGKFSLSVSAPATYHVFFYDEGIVQQKVKVSVLPGQKINLNRKLEAIPYGAIEGRIVDPSGKPVKEAGVGLEWTDNVETDLGATTDANGHYFIAKAEPRTDYTLVVEMPGEGRVQLRYDDIRIRPHRTTRLNIVAAAAPPQLSLVGKVPQVIHGIAEFEAQVSDIHQISELHLNVERQGLGVESAVKVHYGNNSQRQTRVTFSWDSRRVANGRHYVTLAAEDNGGRLTNCLFTIWVQNSSAPKSGKTKLSRR